MMGSANIEAHREEYETSRALQGRLLDADGHEVRSTFAIPEEIPIPAKHPFSGANRKARRAAEARARRWA